MNSDLALEARDNEMVLHDAMHKQHPQASFSLTMSHEVVTAIYLRAVVIAERQARKVANESGAFVEDKHGTD